MRAFDFFQILNSSLFILVGDVNCLIGLINSDVVTNKFRNSNKKLECSQQIKITKNITDVLPYESGIKSYLIGFPSSIFANIRFLLLLVGDV